MSRWSRLHDRLGAAICHRLRPSQADLADSTEHPWSSITFTGARHLFTFRAAGLPGWDAACAFASGIEDAEFALNGALLADLAVQAITRLPDGGAELQLEALTVDA